MLKQESYRQASKSERNKLYIVNNLSPLAVNICFFNRHKQTHIHRHRHRLGSTSSIDNAFENKFNLQIRMFYTSNPTIADKVCIRLLQWYRPVGCYRFNIYYCIRNLAACALPLRANGVYIWTIMLRHIIIKCRAHARFHGAAHNFSVLYD